MLSVRVVCMSIGPWDFGGFDIVVLLILTMSGLMALSRGFIREIVSVIALVVGLVAALFLFGRFQGAANQMIQPSWLADGALGIGSFFIAYFLVTLILRGGAKKLQGREVGVFDRLLGFVFGIGRGLLIASLFVVVTGMASKSEDSTVPEWLENTTFYPILGPIAQTMTSLPFAQIKEQAEDTIERGRNLDTDSEADPESESQP